jgi:arylsulfatase A-like enzyme
LPGKYPNIIFFLTDDQDIMLGGALPATSPNGATPLPRAKALLMDQGAHLTNMFIHTPICCPSRAETLTGRYLHNVKVSRIQVQQLTHDLYDD